MDDLAWKTVYIKNFSLATSETDLIKLIQDQHKFTPFSVTIKTTPAGESKGFGFVVFHTLFEAKWFIDMCEKEKILIDGYPLYANLHQTKEERLKELEQKHSNPSPP